MSVPFIEYYREGFYAALRKIPDALAYEVAAPLWCVCDMALSFRSSLTK